MHDSETGIIAQSPRRRHTADAISFYILAPSRFLAPCPLAAEISFPEILYSRTAA
jgi:hypothetical protein